MKKVFLNYDLALALYNEGNTDAEIAEIAGTCVETVGNWRRDLNLEPNRKKKQARHLSRLEQCAVDARKAGMTYGQYMAQFYVPGTEVRRRRHVK